MKEKSTAPETALSNCYPNMYPSQYNYKYYLNASNESKAIIEDTSVSWSTKEYYYWRFLNANIAIFQPDSVIKAIWEEALANSPISICDFYSFIFIKPFDGKYLKNAPVSYYYYLHNEKPYFDSCCLPYYQLYDSTLMKVLFKIYDDDQTQNVRIMGPEQDVKDKKNQEKVDSIISKLNKYPGRSLVGWPSEKIVWSVIQHAPLEYQLKYFPLISDAVAKRELDPKYLAYSIDRIKMAQELPQIYGTQFVEKDGNFILYKLEDLSVVDEKRKSVGLQSLKSYMESEKIKFE